MTEDASPENLRKFLKSDDPELVGMGILMAKGMDVEVTIKDLEHFLDRERTKLKTFSVPPGLICRTQRHHVFPCLLT